MPTNWKYIKKQLEKEFLCEKLRKHITYDLTLYEPAPWYQQHFIMKFDDQILLDAAQPQYEWDKRAIVLHDSYRLKREIANELYEKHKLEEYDISKDKANSLIHEATSKTEAFISHYNGVYGVEDIIGDIGTYLHSDIQKSLNSSSYFIRALAVLDRRCGKRTLEKLAKERWVSDPMWLKDIYRIRFDAEDIPYNGVYNREGTR